MSEPKLAGDQIQGDSLAGFRKDHVSLLFLRFDETRIANVKLWLTDLVPLLARLGDVAHFNAAFKAQKKRLGDDPPMTALWRNIGFTAPGLFKLAPRDQVECFETAFLVGAAKRAAGIGDPTRGPGSPAEWLVGGPGNEADAMLNLAADREVDLKAERKRMLDSIAATGGAITVVHEDTGNAWIAPQKGHEHFGFKDGVSQPGIRGLIGSADAPLTRRDLANDDPLADRFGAPGQPLLFPGEFIVNYDRQSPTSPTDSQPEDEYRTEPDWADNGSYLVYRRLRQDVRAFRKFIEHGVKQFRKRGIDVDPERFGAMCVGRWKSGVPIARAPLADDPAIAADDKLHASQSFFFASDTLPVRWKDGRDPDAFHAARSDGDGLVCPLAGHVRKVNPRDEGTDLGGAARTLRRRILRRGVTYGPAYKPREKKGIDRGLLFLCYQRSIAEQFEFVWRVWSNKSDTPRADAGVDPIIGQNGDRPPEERTAHFAIENAAPVTVSVPERFIISTGGAYLFVPSIDAIAGTLAR